MKKIIAAIFALLVIAGGALFFLGFFDEYLPEWNTELEVAETVYLTYEGETDFIIIKAVKYSEEGTLYFSEGYKANATSYSQLSSRNVDLQEVIVCNIEDQKCDSLYIVVVAFGLDYAQLDFSVSTAEEYQAKYNFIKGETN